MTRKVMIVRQTSPTTATLEPSDFQSDSPDAIKGFVKEFNKLELESPRGVWAVVTEADEPAPTEAAEVAV